MKKTNQTFLTLIFITLLTITSCKNSNSNLIITHPTFNSQNDILKFESSFSEIIPAEKSSFKSISETGVKNSKRFASNIIIVEIINPKAFPISENIISEQINIIKEKAELHIKNIDEINEIRLILKWTEKGVEKKKSVKI